MSENLTKAEVFNNFVPEVLAELETQALFSDLYGEHKKAFIFQKNLVGLQFGLSDEAAKNVLKNIRPDESKPPKKEGFPGYFQQLSQETGLNFKINPELLALEEPTLGSLASLFSTVYGVEPEKLYPAMEYRIAASKCLDRSIPDVAMQYYKENLVQYYTLLKAAIS